MKQNFPSPPPLNHKDLTHIPVLYHEVLTALNPQSGGDYLDGTLGMAGHAWGILSASSPNGTLLGIDQDPTAIDLAKKRLQYFEGRWQATHSNFAKVKEIVTEKQESNTLLSHGMYDGILLDLGFSSLQMDNEQRGFSFRANTPLDMRLDPTAPLTAADLINTLDEKELANLIYKYGEEHKSRRIAREIVRHRPFYSAKALGDLIARVLVSKKLTKTRSRIHPATKTFQALRIAVNHELDVLEQVLPDAISLLKPSGKLAIITFHSLEDRIVKHYFRQETTDCLCPPQVLFCRCDHKATLNRRQTTRKPILPTVQEIRNNPRARSAKLRVAVRL